MKNIDKWHFYMKDVTSPDNYITCGFYYMISAALQRRVWIGSPRQPIFPNVYIILCGDPGVGKGLVIKQVESILRFHKRKAGQAVIGDIKPDSKDEDALIQRAQVENDVKDSIQKAKDELLLIPVAPSATTYEKLVSSMASSVRAYCYRTTDSDGKSKLGHGYQSSLCFCLEEISSLFKSHTHDLVNFLLQAYDCGDYRYETLSRGEDIIKNCCLSFFGGTTPDFIARSFGTEILGQGFSSRTWFIYAPKNRKEVLFIEDFTPEQEAARNDILAHVKKLTGLYGQVRLEPDALIFMKEWWENINPTKKANASPRLIPYYSRKQLHVLKLAAGIHFADKLDMTITLDECQSALALLESWEMDMHHALCVGDKNPLSELSRGIQKYLGRNGPTGEKDLFIEFYEKCPESQKSLQQSLSELKAMGKIDLDGRTLKWRVK